MIRRTRPLLLAAEFALCIVALVKPVHADLQIAGYQDRLHDPYYLGFDKAFIGAAYNWSGVGRIPDPAAGGVNWKSLVMISDNYFITAFHNQPNRGNDPAGPAPKARFYRTLDPNGEYWESEIAVVGNEYIGQRIGQTDLWVGKLATTPPDWVMRYPLAKRHEATNYLSYTDNDLFVFGQDSPRGWTGVRVGRNEIDSVDVGGNLTWTFDSANGLGADEAATQMGDSGAPSFFSDGNLLVLAGIHTRENFDTGISKNLQAIGKIVPETISFSTGLVGDINGDFRIDLADLGTVGSSYRKVVGARYFQGDLNGDGQVAFMDFIEVVRRFNSRSVAPADFDADGEVDGNDLNLIASNWQKSDVRPFTAGDTNGDEVVNILDVEEFDRNQFRAAFGPLPPPLFPVSGDLTGNGVIDGFDLAIVNSNLGSVVVPGTSGDADGNGFVDKSDLAFVSTRIGTSFGDLNGDGEVGPADFTVIANRWNQIATGGRQFGDLNGDWRVNTIDANILFEWWGQQGGEFPGMLAPEPGCAGLAVIGVMGVAGFVGRRRRGVAISRGPC